MQYYWIEVENPPGKNIARWRRTTLITEDNTVFVPAAIGGNEHTVHLCTMSDGTPYIIHLDHVYVPSNWLASEFPDTKEICDLLRDRTIEMNDEAELEKDV